MRHLKSVFTGRKIGELKLAVVFRTYNLPSSRFQESERERGVLHGAGREVSHSSHQTHFARARLIGGGWLWIAILGCYLQRNCDLWGLCVCDADAPEGCCFEPWVFRLQFVDARRQVHKRELSKVVRFLLTHFLQREKAYRCSGYDRADL